MSGLACAGMQLPVVTLALQRTDKHRIPCTDMMITSNRVGKRAPAWGCHPAGCSKPALAAAQGSTAAGEQPLNEVPLQAAAV